MTERKKQIKCRKGRLRPDRSQWLAVQLIRTQNEDGSEVAAWVSNPATDQSVVLGFIEPHRWDDFERDFTRLMQSYCTAVDIPGEVIDRLLAGPDESEELPPFPSDRGEC